MARRGRGGGGRIICRQKSIVDYRKLTADREGGG